MASNLSAVENLFHNLGQTGGNERKKRLCELQDSECGKTKSPNTENESIRKEKPEIVRNPQEGVENTEGEVAKKLKSCYGS